MEVGRRVIGEVHLNRDPVELADSRHRAIVLLAADANHACLGGGRYFNRITGRARSTGVEQVRHLRIPRQRSHHPANQSYGPRR
jgi:hypothetical protein